MITLSFSAATKYILSPFAWYAHYLLRLRPVETGSALVFGSALDAALNSLLIDKKEGRTPDVLKAIAEFDKEFSSFDPWKVKYSKSDIDKSLLTDDDLNDLSKPIAWSSLRRKAHLMIEEYNTFVLPQLQEVLLVQHNIELVNEHGDRFTGVIDFVAKFNDQIWIFDNKSTSIAYKTNSANESEQMASYYEALRDKYDLAGVCYVTISKKIRRKKKPAVDIQLIFGTVSEDLLHSTFEKYDQVLDGIKTGRFPCTRNEKNGCCSAPWGCAYKNYCESGGLDKTGLKIEEKR